ncbi:MAG: hypothetical protein ACD_73C00626G0001 [uncultured bacterium]|nr:MAG: hypothetical protein ACD_73C00626G0001 [uncultured bacterium]
MKEQLLTLTSQLKNPHDKLNVMREYLQAFLLRSFHESEAFNCLSFVGGTALRFLYSLPRFSEDLDFSLESKKNYDSEKWLTKLKRDLGFARFDAEITWSTKTNVHNGWIKIINIMGELGLGQSNQKFSIKVEIDTNPPAGAVLERQVVNKYFMMAITHHDLPSLMAGKIHALTSRTYLKGRDYYDLFWYLTQPQAIQPNLKLLQNALKQSQANPWEAKNWKEVLTQKMQTINWQQMIKDVEPFLERSQDKSLLTKEFFMQALK